MDHEVKRLRVCVVGAGPGGLACARTLSSPSEPDSIRDTFVNDSFDITVFEQLDQLGGAWLYDDVPDPLMSEDAQCTISSMYDSLHTNLPKEIMAFPDFPFDSSVRSFPSRAVVLEYVQAFARHYDLTRFILFRHKVINVHRLSQQSRIGYALWQVTVQNLNTDEVLSHTFDAVVVANGHYTTPYIPTIRGQDHFPGKQFHSRFYRRPAFAKGQRVLVVGGGPSAVDIAIELTAVATQVTVARTSCIIRLDACPPNMDDSKPLVKELRGDGNVVFIDDSIEPFDIIIYCTGYHYQFPFLDDSCEIDLTVLKCVSPLYKHLVHCKHPSLFLMGIPFTVVPFVLFDVQSQFIRAVLNGVTQLPTTQEMLQDEQEDLEQRLAIGWPIRYKHKFGSFQWPYMRELAAMAKTQPLPPVLERLSEHCIKVLISSPLTYRDADYELVDEHTWRYKTS